MESTSDLERSLGEQIRRARLDLDIDQVELASRANVSIGALRNLESGRGAQLKTAIRVVRALGLTEWLGDLYPDDGASPLELARRRGIARRRQRASGRR